MPFPALIGHEQVKQFLTSAQQRGSLAHAYLLRGPAHVGKATLVEEFLGQLFCEEPGSPCGACVACLQVQAHAHPDVWWIAPLEDKHQVSIEQVREVIRFAQLSSLNSRWRVVVVGSVAELTTEAANALLKVLEEPPVGMLFFLLDHYDGHVLPTLQSRCVLLEVGLVPVAALTAGLVARGTAAPQARELARLAAGRSGVALQLLADTTPLEQKYELAEQFISLFRPGSWALLQRVIEAAGKETAESSELGSRVRAMLSTWLEVARDVLLLRLGLAGAIRYQKLQTELELLAQQKSTGTLLAICQTLGLGLQKLTSNANPRLTLEWLGVTLPRL